MTMRGSQDPFGGADPLVDKLIGNAYEYVKYVARYVKEIRYVALNMEHIYRVSRNMYHNVLQVATLTSLGSSYEIALPAGVTPLMIINSSVIVKTTDNKIYGASPANFSWVIADGKLTVTVPGDAPAALVGGQIRWLLNWQSPVVIGQVD